MLTEFLEWIGKQAVDATGPQVEEFDPTKVHLVRLPDGTTKEIGGKPIWRRHKASDLDTIVRFAMRFDELTDVFPAVWYNRAAVVCLIDDEDRRERVQFDLAFSPQLVRLQELEKQPLLDNRAIVFLLRTVFKNCLGRVPNLVELLRTVKWEGSSDGVADIQRGKSSVGTSARIAMESAKGTIPEYVVLTVPIFSAGSLAYVIEDVECVVEPIEESKSFKFFPVPGALELAIAKAESAVRITILEGLKESEVPVYYGTP